MRISTKSRDGSGRGATALASHEGGSAIARHWWWVVTAAAVIVVGVPTALMFWFAQQLAPSPVRLTHIDDVTRVVPLRFPSEAVLVDGKYQGGVSRYLAARIRLSQGEVSHFLAQVPFNGQASKTDRAWFDGPLSGQTAMGAQLWGKDQHPESARRYLSAAGSMSTQAPSGVHVLVDLDDPAMAILYLYYND